MMRSERDGTGWQWPSGAPPVATATRPAAVDKEELKAAVHQRLIEELDTRRLQAMAVELRRPAVEAAARTLLSREAPEIAGLAKDELVKAIVDEVLGLGPIEPLVGDPDISEIMVNAPDQVFV